MHHAWCSTLLLQWTMIPIPTVGRLFLARRAIQQRLQIPHSARSVGRKRYSTSPGTEENSRQTAAIPPPTTAKTIPGPIWLWAEPLNSYSRLHSRRPHTVQLVSALIIYLIGDLTAQNIAPTPASEPTSSSPDRVSTYDPYRTVRALIIGGVAAIPGYHWFLFLARNFNYTSKPLSIVLKVVINQVVFTPIFNTYFFGMQSALSGANFRDIAERIQNTVPRSWINSWKLWPAVTAFSFAFVRVELRGLFAGVIAIGWQAYLSVLNQRAARLEEQALREEGRKMGSAL